MGRRIIQLPTATPTADDYFLMDSVESGARAISASRLAEYFSSKVDKNAGSGGETPIGEIISYMGVNAPPGYLICDGTEYPIEDYPHLASHFLDNFGSANYFGGDGESTFAVPDLRGEFLRGSGENSHEDSGDGAAVGEHQKPTIHPPVWANTNNIFSRNGSSSANGDLYLSNVNTQYAVEITRTYDGSLDTLKTSKPYASRPTNTSVLYCIKYEPTYFLTTAHTYSYEEHRVGTWIDGKPLYEKTVDFGAMPNKSEKLVAHNIENVGIIWVHDGFCYNATDDNSWYNPTSFAIPSDPWVFRANRVNVSCISNTGDRSNITAIVTLRYTKTTD